MFCDGSFSIKGQFHHVIYSHQLQSRPCQSEHNLVFEQFVFQSYMGNCTPYSWFRKFCNNNDIRFCDLHSLRHFYASALINEGVDAAAVSGALGHSVISTTTSIYCHVFQQAQAKAGDAIASVLDFSSKKKKGA